jgi:hypothetical protein
MTKIIVRVEGYSRVLRGHSGCSITVSTYKTVVMDLTLRTGLPTWIRLLKNSIIHRIKIVQVLIHLIR